MKKQEIYNFGKKLEIDIKIINLVLEKIINLTKQELFLIDEIDEKYLEKIEEYFSRIVSGEPVEYILENASFYGLDFFLDSRVLVPRDDTEIMVEKTIKEINKIKKTEKNILIDVGTGSSCIAISILKKSENIKKSFVVDISKKALEVSKINIKKYNLEEKIEQLNGDLLNNFLENKKYLKDFLEKNIIITANLPYIKNEDFENIDFETMEFEPELALYGGEKTGFELYEKLIYQVLELKSIYNIKKLILFIEIGFDQKEVAKKFLNKLNLKFEIFKDNGGIDRCVKIFFLNS